MEQTLHQGSAAPLSPQKDQGDNGPTVELTRTEHVLPLDHMNAAGPKLYVGDRLHLVFSEWGSVWVMRSGHSLGRLDLNHSHFPKGHDLDTWSAKVAQVDAEGQLHGHVTHVRLIPFEILDCGCVVNLGGWSVRRCDPHAREVDELLGDKQAYEGFGTPGWDDDPRHEQEQIHRETVQ
jgi:hypothetical protein